MLVIAFGMDNYLFMPDGRQMSDVGCLMSDFFQFGGY